MDMKQLEAFVYVVESGSFSKAGELLHLTQPTISAHVAALEQELRIKLIVRTTKETYPSDAGRLLYDYAKKILSAREEAIAAISGFSRNMEGTVTLAASSIPGQYFLPRMLQSFREKYPGIRFDVQITDSQDVVSKVARRTADIGFSGTEIENCKCIYRDFAGDRLVVITPNEPRFRRFLQTGFPVRQILEEPFIIREPGSGTRMETEQFLREMGVDPHQLQTAVEVHTTESIKKMVSEGLGISVISRSACEDYCSFNKLLAFDFDSVSLRRRLYLIKHKNSILSPIAQVFYDFAKGYYNK